MLVVVPKAQEMTKQFPLGAGFVGEAPLSV